MAVSEALGTISERLDVAGRAVMRLPKHSRELLLSRGEEEIIYALQQLHAVSSTSQQIHAGTDGDISA